MTRSRTTTMLLFAVVLLVALFAWLLGNGSAVTPASAATETPPPGRAREGILVSATGEVLGVPDTLRADFAVGTTAATVDEALNLANAAMTQMQDALVDGGVARADLQTSNASIQPTYGKQGKVTGYAVNEGLTAKIRTTSEAGALITAAIAAGGDAARLSGVSFEIEQDDALLGGAARRNAFADAEAKAELYAEQAGRTLGEVMSVTEDVPSNQIEAFTQSRAEAIPVPLQFPLQSGREQLAVTVTVEWSFLRALITSGPGEATLPAPPRASTNNSRSTGASQSGANVLGAHQTGPCTPTSGPTATTPTSLRPCRSGQ